MRKVVVFNRISLDGFFAGPNGEIDWMIHDPKVDEVSHTRMNADTLLLGRITYQMFASYWPLVLENPASDPNSRKLAMELNTMDKHVFSHTLKEVSWENSTLHQGEIINIVSQLKSGSGADITIFGSGSLIQQLSSAGLIDEYLLIISPVILGKGKSFFFGDPITFLKQQYAANFPSGNSLIHYIVDQEK